MAKAAIRASRPSPAALKRHAAATAAGLAAELAVIDRALSVHGARRRIKRLRSLMRLMRGMTGEDAYRRIQQHLKIAADALAGQRRAEALAAAAARLAERSNSEASRRLQSIAEGRRDAHQSEQSASENLAAAREAVSAAQKAISGLRLPRHGTPHIALAFLDHYRTAAKKLERAFDSGSPEALHEARKMIIHHLHHLELFKETLAADVAERIAALECLREILGDLNDLDELEGLVPDEDPAFSKDMAQELRRRRRVLARRAEKASRPLFKWKRKAFAKRIGAMWEDAAS